MKTHLCKLLKKPVLVVELPDRTADFSVINSGDRIAISAFDEYDNCLDVKGIATNYTLLGKPDEINEDDAVELVEDDAKDKWGNPRGYKDYQDLNYYHDTATESLLSLLDTEIYWENPYREKVFVNMDISASMVRAANREIYSEKWHEAEQKTFDRNRSIIFKKVTPKI